MSTEHDLGHAVVQMRRHPCACIGVEITAGNTVGDAAFDALDLLKTAIVRDVSGLARPWRQRAWARHHEKKLSRLVRIPVCRAIVEQTAKHLHLLVVQGLFDIDEVHEHSTRSQGLAEIGCHLCNELL